jgi:NAD(P)-dependent dehydrogenase (short-subunit alcohol dehydrogenase family)
VAAAYAGEGIPGQHGGARLHRGRARHRGLGQPRGRAAISAASRWGDPGGPEDVDGIMAYLVSDESSFATGATFVVEGHDDV